MRKKQPIIVLLLIVFLVIAGAVNYRQQSLAIDDFEKIASRTREKNILSYLKVAREMGQAEKWDELETVLQYAIKQDLIDFYALSSGDSLLYWGERNHDLTKVPNQVPVDGEFRSEGPVAVVASAIQVGEDKVSIGINSDYNPHSELLKKRRDNVTFDLVLYSAAIVLLAALWSLKDILKIVRSVRSGKLSELKTENMNSQESDMFLRGIMGYAQTVSDLEDQNRRLDAQVLPSLKKEILSGKKPPYDFFCTMVRTDINNFSTIYNTHNVTEFMATINRFFSEVSLTVARYNGLIHEFVGDEVIFYFKDDEHENSFAIALSAVRDINEIAARYHQMTTEARGYPFTVKSSLSHGRVRFGPLVNGFTVAGSVLIETVRILSHIHEKDGNVAYYDGANQSKLTGLIEGVERQRVQLKGFQEEKCLFQYQNHLSLDQLLKNLTLENVSSLTYFRSDSSLWAVLRDLKSNAKTRSVELTLKAIQVLRHPYVGAGADSFSPLLISWIEDLEAWRREAPTAGVEHLTATVTMLFLNLVPKEHFDSKSQALMNTLLEAKETRIIANSLDVLTHFGRSLEKKNAQVAHGSDDLRLTANALVHEGRTVLKPSITKTLAKMIKSEQAAKVASGLYAVGELAKLHRERDMVYYSAQVEFTKLVGALDTYVVHPNAMIRRQSMIALRKVADADLLARGIEALTLADSTLLNEEAARYLGPFWQKASDGVSKAS